MAVTGDHSALKKDPALERWSLMKEDVYKHFKFTPRTTRVVFLGVFAIPAAIYWLNVNNDDKWDWTARKGQPLRKDSKPVPSEDLED